MIIESPCWLFLNLVRATMFVISALLVTISVYEIFRAFSIYRIVAKQGYLGPFFKPVQKSLGKQLPTHLILAVIFQEDVHFFLHYGFQFREIIRSVFITIRTHRFKGGSSISQQTVKLLCFSSDIRPCILHHLLRSYMPLQVFKVYRKLLEIPLTILLESYFSKTEILSIYLQVAPWGTCARGLFDAAYIIFGKSVKELDIAESIFLISFLPRPGQRRFIQPTPRNFRKIRYRNYYERVLLIQRTMSGFGAQSPDFLLLKSPFSIEAFANQHDEDVRIEYAIESVHKLKGLISRFLDLDITSIPAHFPFLMWPQRVALSMIFGQRQLIEGYEAPILLVDEVRDVYGIIEKIGLVTFATYVTVKNIEFSKDLIRKRNNSAARSHMQALSFLRWFADLASSQGIEFICVSDLNFAFNIYKANQIKEIEKIVLLVDTRTHSRAVELKYSCLLPTDQNTIPILIEPVEESYFSEMKSHIQLREIDGTTLSFLSPIQELLYQANFCLKGVFNNWKQLRDFSELLSNIDVLTLATFCNTKTNGTARYQLLAVIFMVSHVSTNAFPRNFTGDRNLLPIKQLMRKSYLNLLPQLSLLAPVKDSLCR